MFSKRIPRVLIHFAGHIKHVTYFHALKTLFVNALFHVQVIAKRRGLDWTHIRKLGELQKALNLDLPSMIQLVETSLHPQPYTKEELLRELETTSNNLDEVSLTTNTRHIQTFKLYQRAIHVFTGECI